MSGNFQESEKDLHKDCTRGKISYFIWELHAGTALSSVTSGYLEGQGNIANMR